MSLLKILCFYLTLLVPLHALGLGACISIPKPTGGWLSDMIVWDQLPLKVFLGKNAKHLEEETTEAMEFWNNTIGCEVFTYGPTRPIIDVLVVKSNRKGRLTIANVEFLDWESRSVAVVHVRRPVPDRMHLVMMHELGHILGLGHEDDRLTGHIMHANPDGAHDMIVPEDTVKALKNLYCRE